MYFFRCIGWQNIKSYKCQAEDVLCVEMILWTALESEKKEFFHETKIAFYLQRNAESR